MLRPARGVCLVRRAQTEETIPGGKIFLPEDTRQKMAAYQVEIIAVGDPEVCENEACQRDHVGPRYHVIPDCLKAGAWAIVRPRSFIAASSDDPGLYFVKIDDVYCVLSAEP